MVWVRWPVPLVGGDAGAGAGREGRRVRIANGLLRVMPNTTACRAAMLGVVAAVLATGSCRRRRIAL